MPFLSIFRKDKSPLPSSPTTSRKSSSFSRAQSRPSLTSTRAASPPPQLADISPQSELSYVLPELDECVDIPTTKRRGVLQRRRESGPPRLSHERPLSDIKPTERPFSALDGFMTHTDKSRDPNIRNSGDSDDDPLVPPPPRASVFAGFSYDDRPKSQSLPDHTRPGPVHSSSDPMPKPSKGLFSWRSKSKEPPAPDESFSLKSFRHVGPPSSPINDEGNSFGSTAASATTTPPTSTPSSIPPTSTPTPRPIPGRSTPTARERVSSVGSEGMMPAGLFRQAARRSSTNLVEDTIEPKPRIRDNDRRGPPTRAWDDGQSSGSERRPRTNSAVGRSSSAIPYVGRKSMALDDDDSSPEPASPFAGRLSESPFGSRNDFSHIPRGEYSQYGSRSDGGIRIARPRPSSPAKLQTTRPGPTPAARQPSSPPAPSIISNSSILSSSPPQLSLGFAPQKRSDSPTKPRHSAPAPRPTRSPIRTTIPTKTNDGPSIKPLRPGSPAKSHGRQKSTDTLGRGHARQQSTDTLGRHGRQQSTDTLGRGHGRQQSTDTLGRGHARNQSGDMLNRSGDNLGHARNQSGDTLGHSRNQSGDTLRNGHRRQPSGDITPEVTSHIRRPSAFEVVSRPKSPAPSVALGSSSRAGSVADLTASRSGSVGSGSSRPKTPIDSPMDRAKSPVPTAASRAKSPAPTLGSRAKSPGPTIGRPTITTAINQHPGPTPASSNQRVPVGQRTKSGTYVPPPRQSSLAPGLVDSDSDESPEEESSDEFGAEKERVDGADSFGARVAPAAPGVGAMRGKAGFASKVEPAKPGQGEPAKPEEQGLSRERTITQRDRAPPRIGVSLFDKPVPEVSAEPPKTFGRTRASHSTSAISAAATARNSAAMAEANRALGVRGPGHVRAPAEGSGHLRTATEGSIHVRAPAETDTDEDEEDEKSDSDESDDNAPLASLAPARRPSSAASTNTTNTTAMTRTAVVKPSPNVTSRPPVSRGIRQPLIDMAGPAPARPARRVPGVGVTRNSSLRGSRSVEDLARMSTGTSVPRPGPRPSVPTPSRPGPRPSDVARPGPRPSGPGPRPSDVRPGPRPSVPGRPGPRPFANSPPSSTGDSSSGKAPLTPRDGSEAGAVRGSDEARRKERRRSEAKASVDLANVINGPGPVDDDDDEDHSPHHSQVGHGMMGGGMGMGWNQSGFLAQGGFGFPASQSMPFLHPQLTGPATAMGFMPPPPPPGASEAYMAAHHQAMMIAKQTYLSAVAQQAMAAATEQWERSSNVGGGSVYGGSQMGGMSMPMMGMYANSAYAASSYEPSVMGGWGSGSVYGGSVYGGGARSEYGGPKPTHGRTRSRTQTSPSDAPLPPQNRNAVPPSTWTTRRTKGI